MGIEFHIEVKAKHLYILTALLAIATGSIYITTAYGGNNPSEVGHTYRELEGVQKEITDSCSGGEAVKEVKSDGTVECESISGGAPSGAIMIFESGCPNGWSRFSALDGRYPRGSPSYGSTGGSSSHNHDLARSGSYRGAIVEDRDKDQQLHKYTESSNHIDPYLEVVYCQKD